MQRREFLLGATALAAAGCSTPGIKLDAPYVSTPYPAVVEMLRVAHVGPTDIVYDLGCGDGRFIVTAAKDLGARGVGVDLDPRRIAEANEAARRAGVSHRVRFLEQDLFNTDLREATVVTLFLYAELNARLAPKLRSELRPGTRIVAYRYGIPGWPPDETSAIEIDGLANEIMLWRVR